MLLKDRRKNNSRLQHNSKNGEGLQRREPQEEKHSQRGSAEFERNWRVSCLGGMIVGREAAKRMVARVQGIILFTGGRCSRRALAGCELRAGLNIPSGGFEEDRPAAPDRERTSPHDRFWPEADGGFWRQARAAAERIDPSNPSLQRRNSRKSFIVRRFLLAKLGGFAHGITPCKV
jgi:hypothetical protein